MGLEHPNKASSGVSLGGADHCGWRALYASRSAWPGVVLVLKSLAQHTSVTELARFVSRSSNTSDVSSAREVAPEVATNKMCCREPLGGACKLLK